ncbi:MAG: patched family protein [Runella slithyformis]|nr:MAG: patched family protein [Runella slithyformis]TAE98949.1 MAG: patched family protein [Runella slithyformis]TAF28486.1 MAG: patched family protein [Runella slithyformis]TAF47165.1 MAG: patched family protein [Runella slithyformis]TAF82053.1 MAG: patched family protein [Runella slithyformis]
MIWNKISVFILKNRPLLSAILVIMTVVMGYFAVKVELSYELPKILPTSDPNFQLYESFKARYGEDGNVVVIGVKTNKMFSMPVFNKWYELNQEIKRTEGVKEVVSNANLVEVKRNDSLKVFDFKPIVSKKPASQADVDTVQAKIARYPFYRGYIISEDGQVHLMAITFDQSKMNNKGRILLSKEIKAKALAFAEANGVEVHLSGLPYIRTEFSSKVSREVILFTILAVAVTGLILLLFFRSGRVMFISLVVVLMGVVWSVGFIVLFGYKISLLTGLIPSLIVVIGVPNSIFLTNKYHEEFARHGNKMKALTTAAEKIGETTFWANVTTSIGFGVFYFTGSILLIEFGLVAALGVMSTYLLCLVLITILYSYLPAPNPKHLARLDGKRIGAFLRFANKTVHHHRRVVYGVVGTLVVVALVGLSKITAIGYIVDDLPENDPILTDLHFFEQHFKGVMPFEVSIDTGRPGRVLSPQTLTKIKILQKEFTNYAEFTKPISLVEALKFVYQGYRGGDPKYYVLPGALELNKLAEYAGSVKGKENRFKSFVDSTRRYTRVSFQIPDVGTKRVTELYEQLQPKVDSIFNFDRETNQWVAKEDRYEAQLTGNSVVFTKGNSYLLQNLVESTLYALVLISIVMVILFGDIRMILVAVVPSLIPLLITAGIMGFMDIHLKPSTTLIFSIAFGLSSDGTIYFITKYKDELRNRRKTVSQAIAETIQFTGISMFYTAAVLFAGFAIFTASTFKGTVALGILVSITLLMGMLSNLILLPSFLIWMNQKMMDTPPPVAQNKE